MSFRKIAPRSKPYRCLSTECQQSGGSKLSYYFSSPEETCPRCGRKGNLFPLEEIHLVRESSLRGVLRGSALTGKADRLYEFLCERSQTGYTEKPNHPDHPRHFTFEPSAATCFACLIEYGASLSGASLQLKTGA